MQRPHTATVFTSVEPFDLEGSDHGVLDPGEAVRLTPEELAMEVRLMAALKMFELGKLSSGKAAELAGLSRVDFMEACGRYRVSLFNHPPEEIEAELRSELTAESVNLRRWLWPSSQARA